MTAIDPKETGKLPQEKAEKPPEAKLEEVVELRARGALDRQKDLVGEELGGVARALRATAEELRRDDKSSLSPYAEKVATAVDRLARGVREKDLNALAGEVEIFARRRPLVFLGGAAVAGFLCGRFFRSSRRRSGEEERHGA